MKINIVGRKINLRDSFKDRVEKKLAKFERIFGDDATANVTVTLEKNRKTVEVTVRSKGVIYRAEDTNEDLDTALDLTMDHLAGQIRKNKTKLDKRLKSDPYAAVFAPLEADEPPVDEEDEFNVVRTKKFPIQKLDIDNAILEMNMLGHDFFMFRNEETGEINVVYRRREGDYGLLVPEN